MVERGTDIGKACDLTAYESHLCRTLRKTTEEQRIEGIVKYSSLFAHVLEANVHPTLIKVSKELLAKQTASSAPSTKPPKVEVKKEQQKKKVRGG